MPNSKKDLSVTGYCPYNGENRSIIVEYTPVIMSRQVKPGYKKTGMKCKYFQECTKLDSYGRCLILVSAPPEP